MVVHDDGTFTIPQVDVAIDCGRYVNPEGVRKQIVGASIYGNTVACPGHSARSTVDFSLLRGRVHENDERGIHRRCQATW